ncbi:hypothetical protein HXW87_16465 [Pseudomonas sp. Y5-11]|nr:hypothetical protein HXW87_16465 [Pseudomonas sp. Y5-11]
MPTVVIVVASNMLTADAMIPYGPAVMIRFLAFSAAIAGDAARMPGTVAAVASAAGTAAVTASTASTTGATTVTTVTTTTTTTTTTTILGVGRGHDGQLSRQ